MMKEKWDRASAIVQRRTAILSRIGRDPSLQNIVILFSEKFVRIFGSLLIGAWVIRYLGPHSSGFISYTGATLAIMLAVAKLGLDQILLRDVTLKPDRLGEIFGTALFLRFVSGLIMFLIFLGYSAMVQSDLSRLVMAVVMSLTLLVQPAEAFEIWFQGTGKIIRPVIARSVSLFIISALRIMAILSGMGLFAFIIILTLDAAIVGAVNYYFFRKDAHFKLSVDFKRVRELLGESWPLLLSSLVIIIYMRIDQVMLGSMLDAGAVGIFSAATALQEAIYFIPTIIYTSTAARLTREYKGSQNRYSCFLSLYLNATLLYAVIISAIIFFNAQLIIDLIYGAKFAKSADVLKVYTLSFVFVSLGVAQTLWFINEGKSKYLLQKSIIGAVVNIVANVYLIPRYGPVGAAWATVLAQGCATLGSNLIYGRELFGIQFGIPFRRDFIMQHMFSPGAPVSAKGDS